METKIKMREGIPPTKYAGKTFEWTRNGKKIASITLYDDGIVNFRGRRDYSLFIEKVGTKEQQIFLGTLEIKFTD